MRSTFSPNSSSTNKHTLRNIVLIVAAGLAMIALTTFVITSRQSSNTAQALCSYMLSQADEVQNIVNQSKTDYEIYPDTSYNCKQGDYFNQSYYSYRLYLTSTSDLRDQATIENEFTELVSTSPIASIQRIERLNNVLISIELSVNDDTELPQDVPEPALTEQSAKKTLPQRETFLHSLNYSFGYVPEGNEVIQKNPYTADEAAASMVASSESRSANSRYGLIELFAYDTKGDLSTSYLESGVDKLPSFRGLTCFNEAVQASGCVEVGATTYGATVYKGTGDKVNRSATNDVHYAVKSGDSFIVLTQNGCASATALNCSPVSDEAAVQILSGAIRNTQ